MSAASTRPTDGGVTWNRVLHVDDITGATELVMDPSNNKTLYAATYQRRRQQWGMNGGGPGSNIWKSTDGGQTWAKLEIGLPAGPQGPHRSRRSIAAIRTSSTPASNIETKAACIARTTRGATWRKMSDTNPRPMYFGVIKIDPQTDSRIYVPGVSLHISDDGGRTFRADGAERIHVDHHAMWINPRDPRHLIIGNDGGVSISHDRSRDLGVAAEPARRAVVSRRVRHADAVSRLHRPAGQQHLVRSERGAHQQRRHQRRLVCGQRRRRFPAADGSHRRAHRLCGIAGRPHEPRRSADQRAHHRASRAGGAEAGRHHRPVSIQLGHRDAVVAVRSGDHLHRRQHGAEVVGPRPLVSADQPRPHHQHRSRNAVDHGRASARTSSSPSTTASARSATSSRSRNRRRSKAWSGSAATTASSA